MATVPALPHVSVTVLEQLRPGDHLCHLYAAEDEHRAVLTPFLQHGLERNERVLYVADFHTPTEILKYLCDAGLDVDAYLVHDQLRLLSPAEAYVRDGAFDPRRMIALLEQETELAVRDGFTALRVTGEMTWALRGLPGSDRLIEYEIALDRFFETHAALAICQYDRRRFNPELLLRVIEVHPAVIVGTEVCDNFYFVPSQDLARPDRAARQLQRQLDTLTERRRLETALWQQRRHLEQEIQQRTREIEQRNYQLQHEVDERRQAEDTLRESEEKYRRLVEHANEAIYIVQQGHIQFVNLRGTQLTGRSEAELVGHSILEFTPDEDHAVATAHHDQLLSGQLSASTIERRIVARNGETHWLLINAVRIHWNGQPATLNLASDITERKRAEQTLQARLRLAHFAVDHSLHELLVATLDEVGQITGSPIGFYHFLDADQKTLTLQAWSTRTTAEFCTAAGQGQHYGIDQAGVWVDCVRQRRPVIHNDYAALPAEQRKGLPPGHAHVSRELVVPVFRGESIVAILGVGNKAQPYDDRDLATVSLLADLAWEVAERKRMADAEHDQRALADALRDAATALNSTLNLDEVFDRILLNIGRVMPHEAVSIMLVDDAQATARVARYHGYAAPGTAAQVHNLVFEITQTLNLKTMYQTKRPLVITDVHEYAGWLSSPERSWIRSYAGVPICSREQVVGFLNLYSSVPGFYAETQADRLQTFADQAAIAVENAQLHARIQTHVDELEQRVAARTVELTVANQKLGDANLRLTELDRLKDEFVSRISHELRTPLTSIRIYLDLLENGKPEKREKYLRILNEQSERLLGLIESLLDVSRLNVTTSDVQLRPIDLNDAAADLVNNSQQVAAQHGLTLTLAAASERPIVQADAVLLPQALLPIMSNALAYTPAGGSITVTTGVQQTDRLWGTLTVRDTGPGIDPAETSLIFERFYRGTVTRDYKTSGAGLGLSISLDLITKCGGHITVESTLGAGAAFTVWLPLT